MGSQLRYGRMAQPALHSRNTLQVKAYSGSFGSAGQDDYHDLPTGKILLEHESSGPWLAGPHQYLCRHGSAVRITDHAPLTLSGMLPTTGHWDQSRIAMEPHLIAGIAGPRLCISFRTSSRRGSTDFPKII